MGGNDGDGPPANPYSRMVANPYKEDLRRELTEARRLRDEHGDLLRTVRRAMEQQAWISPRADEFSAELLAEARHATDAGDDTVTELQTEYDNADDQVTLGSAKLYNMEY